MAHDNEAYFRRRAEQELDMAQRAIDGAVVCAHYRLAEAYLERLEPGAGDGTDRADKSIFDFMPSSNTAA